MKRIIIISISLILIIMGCRTMPFVNIIEMGRLGIIASWGQYDESKPDGIVVHFYPETNSGSSYISPIKMNLANTGGSDFDIPYCTYIGFAYNDYTEDINFRGMEAYSTAEAYLGQYTRVPFSRNLDTKYISSVNSLFLQQIPRFKIDGQTTGDKIDVEFKLRSITIEYDIHVTNISNVIKARGSLSGVAESIYLSTGKSNITYENKSNETKTVKGDKSASVIFDFEIGKNSITATLTCFELLKDLNDKNVLNIGYILRNGDELLTEYVDITEYITDDIRKNGGLIVLPEIVVDNDIDIVPLPTPGVGGGAGVGVDDWGEIIDIPLGN